MTKASGTLYGIGVGPGDPELITLKAVKALKATKIIGYFRKKGRSGYALGVARAFLSEGILELPFEYPVTTEIPFAESAYVRAIAEFYSASAGTLRHFLEDGCDVALLCEGDPFFYGSFLHMYERLRNNFKTVVIPGITGMSGCWTAAGAPITLGDDILTVLPGTLGLDRLAARLKETDAAAIMKVGCNLPKIREALKLAGRLNEAVYVERGTMERERVAPLSEIGAETAPYFSIILVPGCRGRRIA